MSNTVTGVIAKIFETKQVSEKFTKREVVINTAEQYPQSVILQFTKDKCSVLDNYKEGQTVTVHYNLQGREWTDPKTNEVRYFNTLQAWKIEKAEGAPQPMQQAVAQPTANLVPTSNDSNDLPF